MENVSKAFGQGIIGGFEDGDYLKLNLAMKLKIRLDSFVRG